MSYLNDNSSDYGSFGSRHSSLTGLDLNCPAFQGGFPNRPSSSYADLVNGRCTIQDVMREFRMNGSDVPYEPNEDWPGFNVRQGVVGYTRQQSWPMAAADRPRPVSLHADAGININMATLQGNVPHALNASDTLTEEHRRVLNSLSDEAVAVLLRELQKRNRRSNESLQACRFCKKNNERESCYRSHSLKDAFGRVSCPVLRAYVCPRCGATEDNAHTMKYCPRATAEERLKSAGVMASIRKASGRRRVPPQVPYTAAVASGATNGNNANGYNFYHEMAPLNPLWAELEQKLSML